MMRQEEQDADFPASVAVLEDKKKWVKKQNPLLADRRGGAVGRAGAGDRPARACKPAAAAR